MKIKSRIKKVVEKISLTSMGMVFLTQTAFAGSIESTTLATGTQQLISDITSWLTGIGAILTVLMVVYCLVRRNMADEMDHKKWQQRMTVSLVSGIGVVVASSVINVLVSYYQ